MATITPHLVVRDVVRAAHWYAEALGAKERSRVPLPGGAVMTIELLGNGAPTQSSRTRSAQRTASLAIGQGTACSATSHRRRQP
jgi:uncharacterized glyoxalase superfamily protein PhnB